MSVLRPDGTARVRLIAPGHGSSGYYSEALLQRVAPRFTDAFMYWDHATAQEDAARPEGSLQKLAGKIIGTPTYETTHPSGAGLYANVKVYEPYRAAVESMGTDIGISIRAMGKSRAGVAPDGRKANLIEDIVVARSADWVTAPGANGRAIEIFESARSGPGGHPREEDSMTEAEARALQESMTRLEEQNRQQADELRRLQEREILREAQSIAAIEIGRAQLPDMTRARLVESLASNPPVVDGLLDRETYQTRITEAVQRASAEVAAIVGSGQVRGLGSTLITETEITPEAAEKELVSALGAFGLRESAARLAVGGR